MLTILSASYNSAELLSTNYELVKRLNPRTPFQWIVAQNTPDLSPDDPRFILLPGATLTSKEKASPFYRSIHHAKALNQAFLHVTTRFVLILDPDCFIFMPDWIERTLSHMQSHDLAFFGAPYHSRAKHHYQGFPTVICLLIDRKRLPSKPLDFLPEWERFAIRSPRCRDTGYKIYRQYRSSVKHHTLTVVDPQVRLPWLCKTPRRKSPSPLFANYGDPSEQFFWDDTFFAFHIKGVADYLSESTRAKWKHDCLKKVKELLELI